MSKLTKEELDYINESQSNFQKLKINIADLELNKASFMEAINKLRSEFNEFEIMLTDKYGKDSVIDMSTGEIKQKDA
jgi:ABC-type phosphate transport system auxiliary subunit